MTSRRLFGLLLVLLLAAMVMVACLPGMSGESPDDPPPDDPLESEPDQPADPPDDAPAEEDPAEPQPPEEPAPVEPNSLAPDPDAAEPDDGESADSESEVIELEEQEVGPPMNIVCTEDTGCTFTEMSPEEVQIMDPEAVPYEDLDLETSYRMICIVGYSCYRVTAENWSDEDTRILVGSDEDFFTAHSEAPLAGSWQVTNHEADMACAGVEVKVEESMESGVVTELDNGDLIATGFSEETEELSFVKFAYGTYISHLNFETEEGSGSFVYYLALQSDDSFFGFFNAELNTTAGKCNVTRKFDAMR